MKTLIIFLVVTISLLAQSYKVLEVKGDVKYQSGTDEKWSELKEGVSLGSDAVISTGENSSVQLEKGKVKFTLNENSAVSTVSIKQMTLNELLLALAMEDIINAPKTNGKSISNSTVTYGTKEDGKENITMNESDFGLKRLNGAAQLSKNGLKESAVVFAKETYRKYPDSKSISSYRIIFANILYEKGLYEEALEEFNEISWLQLNDSEKKQVESTMQAIKKILLTN